MLLIRTLTIQPQNSFRLFDLAAFHFDCVIGYLACMICTSHFVLGFAEFFFEN
jgi:hypothetical protein